MVDPSKNDSIGAFAGFNEGNLKISRILPQSGTDLVRNFPTTSNLLPMKEGIWIFKVSSKDISCKLLACETIAADK